jgi:hypothetical protein
MDISVTSMWRVWSSTFRETKAVFPVAATATLEHWRYAADRRFAFVGVLFEVDFQSLQEDKFHQKEKERGKSRRWW